MIDICLLGSGGMMPLPYRYLTSLMVRYNGKSILIDCGEGTQMALRRKGWSPKPIDLILFTHFHADHISGLPGFLLTMGNAERTEPLTIVGPKGVERVVNALRIIAPELPFPIRFVELNEKEEELHLAGLKIDAFKVNHNITCYGYSLSLARSGKFGGLNELMEPMYRESLKLGSRFLFLGDGAPVHGEKIREILGEKAVFALPHLNYLRPSAAGVLALHSGKRTDYLNLQATYLRPPNAQKNKKLLEAMGMKQA